MGFKHYMRYLKFVLSSIIILFVAAIIIWLGVFAIIFSLIAAPVVAWWMKRQALKKMNSTTSETSSEASYKVIEAKYEIIEK